jgi:hypothetical protein
MRNNSFVVVLLSALFLILVLISCTDKYPPATSDGDDTDALIADASGCVECHLDESLLQQVATPLPPDPGGGGEG